MSKVKQWMRMELVGKRWMPYILVTPLSFSSHANLSQMVYEIWVKKVEKVGQETKLELIEQMECGKNY
jgi:hypothetical protein